MRLKYKKKFEVEICHKRNPFHMLTSHIIDLKENFFLKNKKDQENNLKLKQLRRKWELNFLKQI